MNAFFRNSKVEVASASCQWVGTTRITLLAALVVLTACTHSPQSQKTGNENTANVTLLSPENQALHIHAEIADEPDEQQRGLMFRDHLDPGRGMLFIFEQPRVLSFWMKNTLIPLDILFFDPSGNLISWKTMEPCHSDQCQMYQSEQEALTALEVPAGYVKEYGVGEGWKLNHE